MLARPVADNHKDMHRLVTVFCGRMAKTLKSVCHSLTLERLRRINKMKICPKCQYQRQSTDTAPDYECPKCGIVYAKYDPNYVRPLTPSEIARKKQQEAAELKQQLEREAAERQQQLAREAAEREKRIASICLTTTGEIPGRELSTVIDVISSQCAFGMNIIQDNLVAISDVFGGRSGTLQNNLSAAKKIVMRELREEAYAIKADAVIGVNVVYNQFSGTGKSMVFVVATGTAVKLK